MRAGDERGRELARQQIDAATMALGERGPVWWNVGAPDVNRHMVKNTMPRSLLRWSPVPTGGCYTCLTS